MNFTSMTISEIVEWLEAQGAVTPADIAALRQDVRKGVRRVIARWEQQQEAVQQESKRLQALWLPEKQAWHAGYKTVAGVDEAGRGPLAGPVVAAAVMFEQKVHIPGINDSKRLTPEQREAACAGIREKALAVGVGVVDNHDIDRYNILRAAQLAMQQAVQALGLEPALVLVDGNQPPQFSVPAKPLVRGDSLSFSIAAASIIAKVTRDGLMVELDKMYPQYGFATHKGYPCREHYQALERFGPCAIHRQTFLRKFYERQEQA